MADYKYTPADFKSDQEVRWCPGCGDHAILNAVQRALPEIAVLCGGTVLLVALFVLLNILCGVNRRKKYSQ